MFASRLFVSPFHSFRLLATSFITIAVLKESDRKKKRRIKSDFVPQTKFYALFNAPNHNTNIKSMFTVQCSLHQTTHKCCALAIADN